jgi:tetratricopeptide (TPR) repeat protein
VSSSALDVLKEDPRDRFSIVVAVLAVLTTLVAAGVGILFARSSNEGEKASSEAFIHSLAAAKQSDVSIRETDQRLRLFEQWRERSTRARHAHERRLISTGTNAATFEAAEARWDRLANESSGALRRLAEEPGRRELTPVGRYAPERETFFPFEARARARRDSFREAALRDAANAEASDWGKRGSSYAAILTLLAVALYLFGFALTPQGRQLRGLFASVGLAFLVLCTIFGPVRALSSPNDPPLEAARAYADGVVASAVASTPSEYQPALRAFDRAIALRPDFAAAYRGRADARFYAEAPKVYSGSLTSPFALREVIQDRRMAWTLGIRTPNSALNLGFELFLLGLLEEDTAILEESLEFTRIAIEGDPNQPISRFNKGVTLLALDEEEAATEAYGDAVQQLLDQHSNDISGALTDLELVTAYGPPTVLDDAQRMREFIIGSVERKKLGASESNAAVADLEAFVEPGEAGFFIHRSEGLAEGDWISAQWYHFEPKSLSWSNISALSYRQRLSQLDDGTLFNFSPYTSLSRACLPNGKYRVDLYENGRLIGQRRTTVQGRFDFEGFINHDVGVLGCVPVGWKGGREHGTSVRAYLSPEKDRGLVLVRLDGADPPPVIDTRSESRAALDQVLMVLGDRFFPSPKATGVRPYTFLQGLGRNRIVYEYDGGEILAGAATDNDGSLVAAFAFGPASFFQGVRSKIIASLDVLVQSAVPES